MINVQLLLFSKGAVGKPGLVALAVRVDTQSNSNYMTYRYFTDNIATRCQHNEVEVTRDCRVHGFGGPIVGNVSFIVSLEIQLCLCTDEHMLCPKAKLEFGVMDNGDKSDAVMGISSFTHLNVGAFVYPSVEGRRAELQFASRSLIVCDYM